MGVKRSLTLMACLLLVTAVPSAVAQDDGGQQFDKTVETQDEKVTIEVTRTTEEREDTLTYTFATSDANLTVAASSQAPPNGSDDDQLDQGEDQDRPQLEIGAQLHQILEYRPGNGSEGYTTDAGEKSSWNVSDDSDQHTQDAPNGTLQWQPLQEEEIQSDDGVSGWHIHARAEYPVEPPDTVDVDQDPEDVLEEERETGNFTVDLYTFTHPAEFQNDTVDPTEVVVVFGTDGYPYEASDSELALIFETWSSEGTPEDPTQGLTAQQEILGLDAGLEILWEDQATVDGSSADVSTDRLEGADDADQNDTQGEQSDASAILVHSYPRAEDRLEHTHTQGGDLDVEGGFLDDVQETPAPGIGLLVATLAAAAGFRRRG